LKTGDPTAAHSRKETREQLIRERTPGQRTEDEKTCSHAFFENASEGTGKLTADPKTIIFSFPKSGGPA
jgi:hypothetical protein